MELILLSNQKPQEKMGPTSFSAFALASILIFFSISHAISTPIQHNFLQCLSNHFPTSPPISQVIHTPNTSSYSSTLQSSIYNLRFLGPTNPKPLFIITPTDASHIQASIICCKIHGLDLRIRSGGHDYEGLSSVSSYSSPFIVVDLSNLRLVTVDLEEDTAWVQSGATLGELLYGIGRASRTRGFPAGLCPTVGVGGHFGGGGLGTMMRKYGLAADHIIDAHLIDADGRIHDRKSMGEDLFWAVRGGDPSSFGVILSWKIRLVRVPPTVTVFTIRKTLEEGGTKLVERWQQIAHAFDENLFIRLIILPVDGIAPRSKTVKFLFNSLFLGTTKELLPLVEKGFPELGLKSNDCLEMPWIQSVLYFASYAGYPYDYRYAREILLNREIQGKSYQKAKSDFLKAPISHSGLERMWKKLLQDKKAVMVIDPMGGRMSEISEAHIPFPYRKGYLYSIQYIVKWAALDDGKASQEHLSWIKMMYKYMRPHVSNSPRAAYVNYRDLDLGVNGGSNVSYSRARIWGRKYFNGNFERLVRVKEAVDPTNFFLSEQSIPPHAVAESFDRVHDQDSVHKNYSNFVIV